MARKTAATVVGLALAMSCGGAVGAATVVRDDTGQTLVMSKPATRVLSLGPHLTEMVYAVGGGDRLVGVIRYSDYPAAAQSVPVIADAFALNYEAIAKLQPDLVLVWGSGLIERHKSRLRSMGLPVFESEIRRVEDIARTLRTLGQLLGTKATAESAARGVEDHWQALQARYAKRTPVRVFYQLWPDPLMTVNHEHIVDRAINACGGVNVFATLPMLTPTVSWEAAVKANPQVIASAASTDEPVRLGRWARFAQVDAVRNGHFGRLDGNLIGRMGPRFVQGVQELCEALDAARK